MAAARPSSDVDICNLALDLLNQNPITSIDAPTGKAAEACARWYHLVRAALLRKHPWKFASIRTTLASTTDYDLPFGYDNAWRLPADFIRLIAIGDDITGIITDENSRLLLRYIYDIKNVNQFDSLFVDMLVIEMALKIGPKFTASEARINALKDDLKRITPASFAVDGQERPPSRVRRSTWIRRRKMNGSRGYGTPFVTFDEDVASPVRYQVENGFILTGIL